MITPRQGTECFVITFQLASPACVVFVAAGISYIIRRGWNRMLPTAVCVHREIRLHFPIRSRNEPHQDCNGFSDRTKM